MLRSRALLHRHDGSDHQDAAVVATHDADVKNVVAKASGYKHKLRKAGRIVMRCDHSKALSRFEQRIDDVEREYQAAQRDGRPFLVVILKTRICVER